MMSCYRQIADEKWFARGGVERSEGWTVTLTPTRVEYESAGRRYWHFDNPGIIDRVRAARPENGDRVPAPAECAPPLASNTASPVAIA